MADMLARLFKPDEIHTANQLINFKRNYKMKFSVQPEYEMREDLEFESAFGRDF